MVWIFGVDTVDKTWTIRRNIDAGHVVNIHKRRSFSLFTMWIFATLALTNRFQGCSLSSQFLCGITVVVFIYWILLLLKLVVLMLCPWRFFLHIFFLLFWQSNTHLPHLRSWSWLLLLYKTFIMGTYSHGTNFTFVKIYLAFFPFVFGFRMGFILKILWIFIFFVFRTSRKVKIAYWRSFLLDWVFFDGLLIAFLVGAKTRYIWLLSLLC